jgi:hypothetical protein
VDRVVELPGPGAAPLDEPVALGLRQARVAGHDQPGAPGPDPSAAGPGSCPWPQRG